MPRTTTQHWLMRVGLCALFAWPVAGTAGIAMAQVETAEPSAAASSGAASGATSSGPGFVEITPESRAAVEKGLAFLAASQDADGSFAANGMGKNVGITGLACLAFMADGHLPGRGKYGANVQRGLDYILHNVHENGLIASGTSHGPMYGHGFATLFLGEIYGMTDDPRVREALIKAVRLIVASQNHEGGWRYQPLPMDADVSVTICQVMALRSARDSGLAVPRETITNAISYVRKCQNQGDGGFRYMLNSGGSAFPRSAAGVASLYYAGVYEDKALERGLDYLHKNGRADAGRGGHYFYGHYYASQAMFLAGGKDWARWFPNIRSAMLTQQQDSGGWNSSYGTDYGSAMALLILQVPNRFLPIFQR